MSELKDYIPLLAVVIGSLITILAQMFIFRKQNIDKIKELRLAKIEETLESIGYCRKAIRIASDTKKPAAQDQLSLLWQHDAKVRLLLNAYTPSLLNSYQVIENKVKTITQVIQTATQPIKGTTVTDEMSLNELKELKKSIASSRNKVSIEIETITSSIDDDFDQLENKLYNEIQNILQL